MASRFKEDQKHEKIVRSLTKLDDNRKCINCNSLGPQYICTDFATFVCMTCSGLHREFTHRVKSISMSKFTAAEIAALQAGGNQRAREIYFKHWDPSRQSFPDRSNPEKLRDFIKAVYVHKVFAGDKPPQKGRLPEQAEPYEPKRASSFSSDGSRSPSFETSKPRYGAQRDLRSSDIGSPRRSDYGREAYNTRNYEVQDKKPDLHDTASRRRRQSDEPIVLSVRDILGDDVPELRIEYPGRSQEHQAVPQKDPRISRFGSFVGGSLDTPTSITHKRAQSERTIDFKAGGELYNPGIEGIPSTSLNAAELVDGNSGWATFPGMETTFSVDTIGAQATSMSFQSSVTSVQEESPGTQVVLPADGSLDLTQGQLQLPSYEVYQSQFPTIEPEIEKMKSVSLDESSLSDTPRNEIPEGFFSFPALQAVQSTPADSTTYFSGEPFVLPPVMGQDHILLPKTRNPFDLPEDFPTLTSSFPASVTPQPALVGGEPWSMLAEESQHLSWSQPASFPLVQNTGDGSYIQHSLYSMSQYPTDLGNFGTSFQENLSSGSVDHQRVFVPPDGGASRNPFDW